MNFTILIHETAADFSARTDPARRQAYWSPLPAYLQALKDAGVFVTGAGLDPPETAACLRPRGGEWQVQDGPFADTKEQLGGFYVIDVPDRDAALAWARRYPHSFGRAVEVRRNLTGHG